MTALIQFFLFFILLPVLYIAILLFDGLLILRSRTLENRWRNLAGVLTGFLIAVVVILLDLNYGPLISSTSQSNGLQGAWLSAVIFALLGFSLLLTIDVLLRRGVVALVIMFTVFGVILSAYLLLNLSEMRTIVAISIIGFLVGAILYFIVFPSRIFKTVRGKDIFEEE